MSVSWFTYSPSLFKEDANPKFGPLAIMERTFIFAASFILNKVTIGIISIIKAESIQPMRIEHGILLYL